MRMLLRPYGRITHSDEYEYVSDIFRGDTNTPLGRPKFLSDEVFNKSLFGELYPVPANYASPSLHGVRGPTRAAQQNSLTFPNSISGRHNDAERISSATALTTVATAQHLRGLLKTIGKLRFDTILVRNLMFIVNAYRTLRLRLRNDLMYNKSIVLNSNAVTREDNTEFILHQTRGESAEYSRARSGYAKDKQWKW